jgi:outer membrane receptor protein involved in Fe transport
LHFVSGFGPSESDTRRLHARVQTDGVVNANIGWSGGIDWVSERGRSTFITSGGDQVPIDRRIFAAFGEGRWAAHDRVSIQAGLRADYITRNALGSEPSGFPPRPTFDDETVVSLNPKVSGSWLVSPGAPGLGADAWTRVHAAFGKGIRPPDAFEIAFTNNPNLRPERSKSYEVGVTQALLRGAIQLDATAFYNQYDDLIVSVGSLRDVSTYSSDNISNARARGLETSAAWRAASGIGIKASYTFLDTEILAVDGLSLAPSPYRVGDRLLRRPTHQGWVALDWTTGRTTVFAALNARGETLDAEPSFGPSGGLYENTGRTLVDLGGGYTLVKGIEIFARILNLFDENYEEVLGFPSPGRTAYAGVRLAARR